MEYAPSTNRVDFSHAVPPDTGMMLRMPLLLSLLAAALAAEDAHAGHDHGEGGAFEWAGIFSAPEDFYLWTAQSAEVRCARGS